MVGVIHLFHQVTALLDAVTQEQHKSRQCDRSRLMGTIADSLLANDRSRVGLDNCFASFFNRSLCARLCGLTGKTACQSCGQALRWGIVDSRGAGPAARCRTVHRRSALPHAPYSSAVLAVIPVNRAVKLGARAERLVKPTLAQFLKLELVLRIYFPDNRFSPSKRTNERIKKLTGYSWNG